MRVALWLGTALSLSACGGSSTSNGSSFESLASTGNNLIATYGNAPITDVQNMPQTSTATYRGVVAYSLDYSDPSLILEYAETLSQLELNANFATSQVSGRAYNFENYDPNITVGGQVNVNGSISENEFTGDVSGTTTESGYGESVNVTYDRSVGGVFVGSGAEAIIGTGYAEGSTPGYGSFSVWMVFGANR